ncbi:hypothetical protein EV421DRAFT_1909099 [Armillaria borealis]|uniref:BTB domain-containing protein n=1 Tax=Armillaria borealis TaxID=47425 RepID=A0AA39J4R2_9AGAR|nr:hypothetical protein EV421DRAFT_1909099 [Armillaria borealis]
MATIPTITIADAPFNDPADSVDLVIRTADNVEFFILSGLLSLKSPSSFFRHVLKSSQHTEERGGFPVLEVEEDSDTFRTILLLCYPDVDPQIKSVDQIVAVKKALDKYCMDHTLEKFIQTVTVSPLMKEEALRIFALALVNGWRVLGEAAAKSTFTIPLNDPEAELEDLCSINALQYVRLRNYHRKCRLAAEDLLDPSLAPWLKGKETELLFLHNWVTSKPMCRWCGKYLEYSHVVRFHTHPWIDDYFAAVKTEMRRRPHPEFALDDVIIADAVTKSISQCYYHEEWKKIATSQVRLCGKLLKEEIDKRISQIPLNIDWTK